MTPQEADGRSNRRHFTDEQKRAMVQETEKPGVAVAEVCRRHGRKTNPTRLSDRDGERVITKVVAGESQPPIPTSLIVTI